MNSNESSQHDMNMAFLFTVVTVITALYITIATNNTTTQNIAYNSAGSNIIKLSTTTDVDAMSDVSLLVFTSDGFIKSLYINTNKSSIIECSIPLENLGTFVNTIQNNFKCTELNLNYVDQSNVDNYDQLKEVLEDQKEQYEDLLSESTTANTMIAERRELVRVSKQLQKVDKKIQALDHQHDYMDMTLYIRSTPPIKRYTLSALRVLGLIIGGILFAILVIVLIRIVSFQIANRKRMDLVKRAVTPITPDMIRDKKMNESEANSNDS